MRKRMLVINLGWEQEPLLERLAKRDDLELYGIHYDDNYFRKIEWKDILVCDLRDLPRILQFAEKVKPQAVISDQCDYSYFAQAVIAERFGLPGPRVAEAQVGTNKLLQRLRAEEAGVPVPEFRACRNLREVEEAARKIGYPVILKPVDNRGSFGVNRVDDPRELREAFYEALSHSQAREVLVEKYISGRHLTVDGYIFQKGGARALAVATRKKLPDKKGIIDGEIVYPGELPKEIYLRALETAETVARGFGFRFGFFHGEFILTSEERIYLTEMSNRGGGVYISEVILPNFTGLNLVEILIEDTLGKDSRIPKKEISQRPTILKFLEFPNARRGGRLERIEGVEEVKSLPEVLCFRLLVDPRDELRPIRSGADRYGFFIGTAENRESLYQLVKKVESTIKVWIV